MHSLIALSVPGSIPKHSVHFALIASLGERVPRKARSINFAFAGRHAFTRSSMAACFGCKSAPLGERMTLETALAGGGAIGIPPLLVRGVLGAESDRGGGLRMTTAFPVGTVGAEMSDCEDNRGAEDGDYTDGKEEGITHGILLHKSGSIRPQESETSPCGFLQPATGHLEQTARSYSGTNLFP